MKKFLALILLIVVISGCKKEENELYIYNWSEYMPDEVLEMFTKETGIDVIYSNYGSNETMYSKLKIQKGSGYDIVVPSTYFVEKLADDGLLLELDHSKIDMSRFRESLLEQSYDKGNKYSVPYLWGPSLIMYNKKYVKDPVTSWKDLWNPKYKGYVLLNNDIREVFQMALMTLGYSGNSVDPKEVKEAYELLMKLIPSVRMFNSDSPKQPFINEEVYIGLIWGGEAYMAMEENSDLMYVYPEEGAIVWMDSMVIMKHAKNVDNAYKFIEFVTRPEIAALISKDLGYATPVTKALDYFDDDLRNNRLMNPTDEDLKNSQFQNNIGEGILLYEKYWERLKTSN